MVSSPFALYKVGLPKYVNILGKLYMKSLKEKPNHFPNTTSNFGIIVYFRFHDTLFKKALITAV